MWTLGMLLMPAVTQHMEESCLIQKVVKQIIFWTLGTLSIRH